MVFEPTPIAGAFLVELERRGDERGFFARLFCDQAFGDVGILNQVRQINTSLSRQKGTLRGLHYQLPPSAEVKVVRCIRGALWDVILDLRPRSPSHGRWFGTVLDAENRRMLTVPRGVAHGFVTLADDTEAFYLVSTPYDPAAERGVRFDDPWHGIAWPMAPVEVSAKDRAWPDFDPEFHGARQLEEIPA